MGRTRTEKKQTSGNNNRSKSTEVVRRTSNEYPVDSRNLNEEIEEISKNRSKMAEMKEAFDQIEKFDGLETENVIRWLKKVDLICGCFENISDEDKLKRIPTKLGKEAFDWFVETLRPRSIH